MIKYSPKLNTIYEAEFSKFGDNFKGMGWKRSKDQIRRFKEFSKIFANKNKAKILDLGCGTSHFYEFLNKNKINNLNYTGIDISKEFIDISKKKFPKNKYFYVDILNTKKKFRFDYTIINGIFTQKGNLSKKQMYHFFIKFIKKAFSFTNKGLAFNTLSPMSDRANNKNFYLSFEKLEKFLKLSNINNFYINHTYNKYEYIVYIFKKN
jgi:SAM-dependent methyltransferase